MLITDNPSYYQTHTGDKVLIGNGYVISGTQLTVEMLSGINQQLNGYEILAAESMISELKELCTQPSPVKVDAGKYLQNRKDYDIKYSLMYGDFKIFVLKRNILVRMIELLLETLTLSETEVELYLHSDYQLIKYVDHILPYFNKEKIGFYDSWKNRERTKNIYYSLHRLLAKKPVVKPHKNHFVLFLFDIASEVDIFERFFEMINATNDITLSIVQVSSGVMENKVVTAEKYKSANINYFQFKDFKAPAINTNSLFGDWLWAFHPGYANIFSTSIYRRSLEVYYSFAEQCIQTLKPDVVIFANTSETGRAVADVCRLKNIPSVNVEYGLFTDDAMHMESNIRFSARACIGETGVEIWKKRNDPTPIHEVTGFLKLDKTPDITSRDPFFISAGMDPGLKTIFFASTWGGTNGIYNQEKLHIVKTLMTICEGNGYQLIIKKHPAETDHYLDELVKSCNKTSIRIFHHGEVDLYSALSACDLLVTQNSSISAEALYYNKPVMFVNLTTHLIWPDLLPFIHEKFAFNVRSTADLEKNIKFIFDNLDMIAEEVRKNALKYIYKPDRNASRRLLDLCLRLKNEYGS